MTVSSSSFSCGGIRFNEFESGTLRFYWLLFNFNRLELPVFDIGKFPKDFLWLFPLFLYTPYGLLFNDCFNFVCPLVKVPLLKTVGTCCDSAVS